MAFELVSDLIRAFREDERDMSAPYFWADTQLVRWVNEALNEFARRTRSIYDDCGVASEVAYGPGQHVVSVHPCVIDVVDAWYEGRPHRHLTRVNMAAWGNGCRGGYWNAYTGCREFRFDPAGHIVLRPTPQEAGVIKLMVIRKPVREVALNDRIPDVPFDDRNILLLHVKSRAYLVADSELFDPNKSSAYRAEFERECQRACEDSILRRGDCSRPIRSRF